MEVSPAGSSGSANLEVQVRVQKGASRQLEAVVSTILSGVEQANDAIKRETGQRLNIVA